MISAGTHLPPRTVLLAVALLYPLFCFLGTGLVLPEHLGIGLRPPAGLALAAMLLLGMRIWPALWLGGFLFHICRWWGMHSLAAVLVAPGLATAATLQAYVATRLSLRIAETTHPLENAVRLWRFLIFAGVISSLLSPTLGIGQLTAAKLVPSDQTLLTWLAWWLGDMTSVVVLTPLLLAWQRLPPIQLNIANACETIVLGAATVALARIVLGGHYAQTYLLMPLYVWAAFRFGHHGVTALALAVSGVAVWTTAHGFGLFRGNNLLESVLLLHAFIAVTTITFLVLCAIITERQQAEKAVDQARHQLEERVRMRTAQLAQTNQDLREEMQQRQRAEQALLEEERRRILLEERERLARDLHDSLSQAFYGISLGAHTARTMLDRKPEQARETLDYVISLTGSGMADMRDLIQDLSPESLQREGLVNALRKHLEVLRKRYDLEVEAHLCDEPEVPLEIKEALFRIAKEGLHNTVRHARAQRIDLHLVKEPGEVVLEMHDNGIGFQAGQPTPGHFGLRSMRERAAAHGGSVEIETRPGSGTLIRTRIPA